MMKCFSSGDDINESLWLFSHIVTLLFTSVTSSVYHPQSIIKALIYHHSKEESIQINKHMHTVNISK